MEERAKPGQIVRYTPTGKLLIVVTEFASTRPRCASIGKDGKPHGRAFQISIENLEPVEEAQS